MPLQTYPRAPSLTEPIRPGDQTRRYDPARLPVRPSRPGTAVPPSADLPSRLQFEPDAATPGLLRITGTIAPGDAARFADWLTSDVGQRTALAYAPDGVALFSEASKAEAEPVEVSFDGDARLGHEVSRAKCRRCHAVDEASRMSTIGSTPSFGILRSLPDWNERFAAFYLLNPHPAFMIIDGVTEPFSDQRPPPIVPIEMSLDEVEALLAYVSAMQAKDLGAPIQHQ